MNSQPDYAELHCQSYYSFLTGTSSPQALVQRAAQLGYRSLALTDECSVAGIVRAHVQAQQHNLHLITGASFAIQTDSQPVWRVTLLAENRNGYAQLCDIITKARARSPKGSYQLHPQDLDQASDCLAIALASPDSFYQSLSEALECLVPRFEGRLWVGQSALLHAGQQVQFEQAQALAQHHGLPCVAIGMVLMARRHQKPLQDVVTAIRLGKCVSECGYALAPNAEQHLRSRKRLAQCYPVAWLQETLQIAQRCQFTLQSLRYEYPQEVVPAGKTPDAYLREQTLIGAKWRYTNGVPQAVRSQIEHELALIQSLSYASYFLTVYDVVRFARQAGILCQGRGSAANSAVCYCLGITEVDPSTANLLFERFISRERNEPPDIDVDFEHQRREEVIQYIYRRYGRHRAALTAVAITYRGRSALRDVGKALGIELGIVEAAVRCLTWWDQAQDMELLRETLVDKVPARTLDHWIDLSMALIGSVRHLSQHPGGFVLSQQKLSDLVPVEPASMPGRSVIQWDKDDLDALGFMKVDVLGLGILSVIRRALASVAWRRGLPKFDMQDIARDDKATFAMICRADTVGVFQIESRAQMNMLPRLRPDCFYDLVIEVAIVRPGPIQGNMVHPYLRRRQGQEPISYPGTAVRRVLERTLGVPIFQEQVMAIAMVAAGFTAGEADALRRAMATWRRKGGFKPFETKLIDGLIANGYERDFAQAIYAQMEGFAEYGFPESHAASFAWLAYVSAWLKCHEPQAFLAALLNSQPVGCYAPSQLIQDARRHGVLILPTDVQQSHFECTLEYTSQKELAVRLGLNQIKGLQQQAAMRIEQARKHEGPFVTVTSLAVRARLNRPALQGLANAGALRSLSEHRRQAMWHIANAPMQYDLMSLMNADEAQTTPAQVTPPTETENLVSDYRQLGYTLGRHPLVFLRKTLDVKRYLPAVQLSQRWHGQFSRACGLVISRQRPPSANGVMFLTLEDETGHVNIILYPQVVERERQTLMHARLLGVIGTWQTQDHGGHLLAARLLDESGYLKQFKTLSKKT